MEPPNSMEEAQRALQRAQEARAEVLGMRPKTSWLARTATHLLTENHFAERVRGTFES